MNILDGVIERLTYHNEDNGYTVARFTPKNKSYQVTVIGAMLGINVGESLRLAGQWTSHSQYGKQFQVEHYTVQLPATIEGIRKYLGSGLIKGIGPKTSSKIVDFFGLDTLTVIEKEPERLLEVPSIGKKRVEKITQTWQEQLHIKEIMLFLQANQVSTSLAVKIYKQYEDAAISIVRNNPYRLAKDVYGIGFKTADQIALNMGMAHDAPQRVGAGLVYTASQATNQGHVFEIRDTLISTASQLLNVPQEACEAQLQHLLENKELIADGEGMQIYFPPFYYAEVSIANKLHILLGSSFSRLAFYRSANWPAVFTWLDQKNPFRLSERQKEAVELALTKQVAILTGGPGTGKSTVTGTIIKLLKAKNCASRPLGGKSFLLAAPTGRAAKRLNETTGEPALTIHRLLEWKPGGFLRNNEKPLDTDLIIIDEASMIDTLLMNHLLKAIDPGTHLLLVGDVDQLPSVGAGNVLRDLIASGQVPTVVLDTIYRQAADSYIIVNAHRINQGQMPIFTRNCRDFFFFPKAEPKDAAALLIDIVSNRLPMKFGVNALTDIQVLSWGVKSEGFWPTFFPTETLSLLNNI